ncbi:MAG: dienelactone hydrolase family protein [Burkholderiaceae bacterium]
MRESVIELKTADGVLDTFICRPDGDGPWPVVIIYMDAPGMRDELRNMASRLATVGYYVMLPNLYYRIGREGEYGFDRSRIRSHDADRERMHECRLTLTNAAVVADTRHLLAHARADSVASSGPVGIVGYCMSGQFVVAVAAAYPDDIGAVASFYGVGIVSDAADSPHKDARAVRARTYLAFAEHDPWVPAAVLQQLPAVIADTGWQAEIEVYPGTTHGFAFAERPDYHRAAGERHWERIFALMRGLSA